MTPAEIEAEAERLFKAWASTLALPADWKLPGEATRAAWLAVAEASLRAREDVRRERNDARRWGYLEVKKEHDLIAPDEERERAALQARAEAEGWGEHGPAAEGT